MENFYQRKVRSVLVIQDNQGKRLVNLDKNIYSLGRSNQNTIVLYSPVVSLHHAILLRMYDFEKKTYYFQLQNGAIQENDSANKLIINEKKYLSKPLQHKDLIRFGDQAKATYLVIDSHLSDADIFEYCEANNLLDESIASIDTFQTLTQIEPLVKQRTVELNDRVEQLQREIAVRRLTEQALHNSEARLNGILNSLDNVVWSVSATTLEVLYLNSAVEKVYGRSAQAFFDNPHLWMEVIYPEDRERMRSILNEILAIGSIEAEYRIVRPDGEVRWVQDRNRVAYDDSGTAIRVDGITTDITARKQAESALQKEREFLKALLENLQDGIVACDANGILTLFNRATREFHGLSEQPLPADQWAEHFGLYLPDGKTLMPTEEIPLFRALRGEIVRNVEMAIASKQGKLRTLLANGQAFVDIQGKKLGAVVVMHDITERKQAEEALRQSETRFQKLVAHVPGMIYQFLLRTDGSMCFPYVSSNCREICELEPEDLQQNAALAIAEIHPAHRESFEQSLAVSAKTLQPWKWEGLFVMPSGKRKWLSGASRPERQANGDILWDGLLMDISDRKLGELELENYKERLEELVEKRTAALLKANKQLQQEISDRSRAESELRLMTTALQNAVEGISRLDSQGRYCAVNKAYARTLGYLPEEMLGIHWHQTVHPEDVEKMIAAYQEMLEFGKVEAEVRGRRKDGSIFYKQVVMISSYDLQEELIGHYCFMKDISDRKTSEAALQQSQEFLRNVIDINPNLIFVKDWDGKFTLVNQAVADIYGTTVENLVGKTDADFNSHQAEVEHYLQMDRQVMSALQPSLIPEETVSCSTGIVRWFQTIKKPLLSVDGQTRYVLGVATDITERKMAEEQIKASLTEKEILLKEIHHRVKNNLQVISSLLKLQSRYTKEPRTLEMLKESQCRVKSMALVHEKLYQSQDLARIDFADYIRTLTKNLLYSYSINLNAVQLEIQVQSVDLNLDTAIPCGLLINELISNALKHAFPENRKGKIKINFSQIEDQQFLLIVQDDGIGLPAHLSLDSTPSLGLRLVNSLATQLQATLEIDISHGTLFKLQFQELKYKHRF
ncbi:MAG: PAS domain S-box protein [Aphanothece sp. CMT-3BRIN-NPC111]|jgi:PAS domain S-box-containing protein|nr:PAS domain S-box protein [Aphanothece sp. CMT-3BRIN-NPC111]